MELVLTQKHLGLARPRGSAADHRIPHEYLSGEFTLDATVAIAMPLIAAISASGLTARELDIAIEGQLREEDLFASPTSAFGC